MPQVKDLFSWACFIRSNFVEKCRNLKRIALGGASLSCCCLAKWSVCLLYFKFMVLMEFQIFFQETKEIVSFSSMSFQVQELAYQVGVGGKNNQLLRFNLQMLEIQASVSPTLQETLSKEHLRVHHPSLKVLVSLATSFSSACIACRSACESTSPF